MFSLKMLYLTETSIKQRMSLPRRDYNSLKEKVKMASVFAFSLTLSLLIMPAIIGHTIAVESCVGLTFKQTMAQKDLI